MNWDALSPQILGGLLRMNWQAGLLIAAVLALRWIMGDRLSPRWRCWLWGAIFLRLCVPVLPASSWSLFNFLPDPQPVSLRAPAVTLPIVIVKLDASSPAPPDSARVPVAAAVSSSTIHWETLVVLAWLAGTALVAARMLLIRIRLARTLARASLPATEELRQLWQACAAEMGVAHPPAARLTAAVSSAAIFGFLRKRLLISPDLSQRISRADLRFVLLHEAAHLRRRDLETGSLITFLRVIHWFNPLAWLATASWRRDSETACDQAVLSITGPASRTDYGMTLLHLAAGFSPDARGPALGILGGKRELHGRLKRIAGFSRAKTRWSIAAAGLLAILGCAGLTDRRAPAAATSPATAPSPMATRVYDIRDLLLPAGMVNDRLLSMADWEALIRQSVTPDVWSNGATLSDFNGSLIVTAPQATKDAIDKLLADIRAGRSRQVTLSTLLEMSDEATMARLTIPVFTADDQVRWGTQQTAYASFPARILTVEDAKKLVSDIASSQQPPQRIGVPRLTLLDQQSGSIETYTSFPYVAGFENVHDTEGRVRNVPLIKSAHDGVAVIAKLTLADDRSVTLDLHVNLEQFFGFRPAPGGDSGIRAQTSAERTTSAGISGSIPEDYSAIFAIAIPAITAADLAGVDQTHPTQPTGQKVLVVFATPTILSNEPVQKTDTGSKAVKIPATQPNSPMPPG